MPNFNWSFFLTNLIILGASAFISFYIVRDSLKASKLKIYSGMLLFSIVYNLVSERLQAFVDYGVSLPIEILCNTMPIAAVIGGAFLYYYFVDEPKGKLTFILLLVAHGSFFCYDIANVTFLNWSSDVTESPQSLLVFALFYPAITWVLQKLWAKVRDVTNVNWYSLSLLPVIFIVLSLAVRSVFTVGGDTLLYYIKMVMVVVIDICAFITYVMLITAISRAQEKERLESNLQSINDNLVAQATRMNELTDHIEEVKMIRHDMRHHMQTLDDLLKAEKIADARAYLTELTQNTLDSISFPLCRNYVADGIVSRYIAIAKRQGITIDATISIPKDPRVDHTDLAIVLGNLIENAVEACERQTEGKKFISIAAKTENDRMFIQISNSFDGSIRKQGDSFLSSKRQEGSGIGLRSVVAIAKKYSGLSSFNCDGNVFKARVLLYPTDSNIRSQ